MSNDPEFPFVGNDAGASPTKHVWRTVGRTSAYFEIF
jgi:hypothetical protein